jgi:hypothetical protein
MSDHAVELRLGAVAYPLTHVEAELVRDWLQGARSFPAKALSARVTEKLDAEQMRSRSLTLGLDDIAALREVICGTDVGNHDGIRSLRTALCA